MTQVLVPSTTWNCVDRERPREVCVVLPIVQEPEIPLLVCFVVSPELESEVECIAQTIKTVVFI